MRSLVDFINHGVLPFTGRDEESGALFDFWQQTVEVQGLRVALLQGEAGIGKSRLVEEVIPRIAMAGGVIVRMKFYPESTTSIAPLLARAITLSHSARKLLAGEPEETLASVLAALRRIARLRPTLVVIEDLHLLGDDAPGTQEAPARELATLLESLAGETISFLCAARALPADVRSLIEPWLVREIPISPLTADNYLSLWMELFGATPGQIALLPLQQVTMGNPLAIRSALRGAITAGTIARVAADDGWKLSVSADDFARRLEQSVGILSEGMAVHLAADERHAAQRIAALGEVVARESAEKILGEKSSLLDGLLFKGILMLSHSAAAPLGEPVSAFPLLAFTHTLVHRHFVALATIDSKTLLEIIACPEAPLYSRLPFQLLRDLPICNDVESGMVRQAIIRCFSVGYALDRTSDWKLAPDVCNTGEWLLAVYGERWDPEQRFELQALLITHQLGLLWRFPLSEEYRQLVGRFLALTEGEIARPLLRFRLQALLYRHRLTWRSDRDLAEAIHQQILQLAAEAPELMSTWTYVDHLRDAAHTAWAADDRNALRRMESQLDTFLQNDEIPHELRENARYGLFRYLINVFDTPEELERRRDLLADLEQKGIQVDSMVIIQSLRFFESTGEIDRQMELVRRSLPRFREQGLQIEIAYTRLAGIIATVLLGGDIGEAVEQAREHAQSLPEPIGGRLVQSIRERLLPAVLLRADDDQARLIVKQFVDDTATLSPAIRILLGVESETPLSADTPRSLFRLNDLIEHSAALCSGGSGEDLATLLQWLEARRLPDPMSGFLRRHGSLLAPREHARWKKRIDDLLRQRRAEQPAAIEQHTSLSMLGVIEIHKPGAEPARLRGARLRSVLGTMVAAQLLPVSLAYQEFCRIAAGEDDLESARRILNVTIFRLREALGAEAIITGGETPRLNHDLIDIDLVEAVTRIRAASQAAGSGALVRALPLLEEAIGILRGEVSFPGLYDPFFEGMREDLELELRTTIVDVATGLMREGDAASAERLLRYATSAMPGDSELIEMLHATLITLGRRADAERVRMSERA